MKENEFERQIPSELGQLVHLKKMTLQSNRLSGDVSGDVHVCNLVARNNLAEFITDCAGVKALPSNVFAVPSACCNVIHSTVLGVDTFGLFICLSGGHIA